MNLENNWRKKNREIVSKAKTRLQKRSAMAHYNEKVRDANRKCRLEKNKNIEVLADEAEDAVKRNYINKLYDIRRKLSGKKNNLNKPVQSKEGKILRTQEEQLSRWREHF